LPNTKKERLPNEVSPFHFPDMSRLAGKAGGNGKEKMPPFFRVTLSANSLSVVSVREGAW